MTILAQDKFCLKKSYTRYIKHQIHEKVLESENYFLSSDQKSLYSGLPEKSSQISWRFNAENEISEIFTFQSGDVIHYSKLPIKIKVPIKGIAAFGKSKDNDWTNKLSISDRKSYLLAAIDGLSQNQDSANSRNDEVDFKLFEGNFSLPPINESQQTKITSKTLPKRSKFATLKILTYYFVALIILLFTTGLLCKISSVREVFERLTLRLFSLSHDKAIDLYLSDYFGHKPCSIYFGDFAKLNKSIFRFLLKNDGEFAHQHLAERRQFVILFINISVFFPFSLYF